MAVNKPTQVITDRYALYNGDCCEITPQMPENSIHMSIYSPPFCGLYNYSSSERDMSNCRDYEEFFTHYEFLVRQIHRVTMPGRMTAVHCMDVPGPDGTIKDFPGDIIRMHERCGFRYHARFTIWKEPLRVAIRTRSKSLMHKQLVKDATYSSNAGADYLLVFRKNGENKIPIAHEQGITKYAGEREVPADLLHKFRHHRDAKTNKLAHWIWQQYASSVWDDVRVNRVLPYKAARDHEDEKHVHPLQLDVIERCVLLWTNPCETVFTPFMGVGSEVCGAIVNGRKGIGIELKDTYFRQSIRNVESASQFGFAESSDQGALFGEDDDEATGEMG